MTISASVYGTAQFHHGAVLDGQADRAADAEIAVRQQAGWTSLVVGGSVVRRGTPLRKGWFRRQTRHFSAQRAKRVLASSKAIRVWALGFVWWNVMDMDYGFRTAAVSYCNCIVLQVYHTAAAVSYCSWEEWRAVGVGNRASAGTAKNPHPRTAWTSTCSAMVE